MFKRLILSMMVIGQCFIWANARVPSDGLPVTHVLMSQFAWTTENFGPPGQRYQLDVIGNDMTPVLLPHAKAPSKNASRVNVCSIFSTDYKVLFSRVGLEEQDSALRQLDQDAWRNYIFEGASKYNLEVIDVMDQWFSIKACAFPDLTLVNQNGIEMVFPLLVLTDPDNVWVSGRNVRNDFLISSPSLPTAEQILAGSFPFIPQGALEQWMRAIELMGSKLYIWYGIPEEALPQVVQIMERWNGKDGNEDQQWLNNIALQKILKYCDHDRPDYEMSNCTKVFQGSLAEKKADGLAILQSLP